jgi:hypothetical protein
VVAAATCPGEPGMLGLLVDECEKTKFLADTGSVFSLVPHQSSAPPSGPRLVTADDKPIACWGACTRTLHVAGRTFTWRFLLAAVAFPIVGADFLRAFGLMVDLAGMRLAHRSDSWHVTLVAPPRGSTFAAIGVRVAGVKPSADPAPSSSVSAVIQQTSFATWGWQPARGVLVKAPGAASAPGTDLNASVVGSTRSGLVAAELQPDFNDILMSFPAVLNASKALPAVKHDVQHVIVTTGRPVTGRYRRLDPARLAAAKKEFMELEKQGIVRRSSSSWSSPLHMVMKPDGTWRPCGDFRRLNLQTEPDRYTCPNMADLTGRLEGCHVFTKLDLRKGYHQVPVEASSIPKTAIITPFGLFEFLRMPFGLRNAGQTFQRMMDRVLQGLDFCFCYLDDVLVASATPQEHVQHLRQTLERLQQHGLVLNGEKCVLGQPEVEYLGHVVSASGIRPLPQNVQALQEYPRPGTVHHLQSFLGMANFYRRFLPAAAQVLKPLTDALRGGKRTKLEWTEEMERAFREVKKKVVEAVELAHPSSGAALVLNVDASNTHVGAVLQQADDRGQLQPLGFFSVKLDQAQLKYSTFDRELLACFLAIRHFRWCVEGRELRVLSDHKPLAGALHRVGDAWSARQQRQLSFIGEYVTHIEHVAG